MNLGTRRFGHASVRISMFSAAAHLPRDHYERVRFLSHIETDEAHRGQGCARRMMQKVLQQADAAQLLLVLEPQPYGTAPLMGPVDLQSWYARLGFQHFQDEPVVLMLRMPRQ